MHVHVYCVSNNILSFQWVANAVNDMYADAVLTVVLQVESNPAAVQCKGSKVKLQIVTSPNLHFTHHAIMHDV